MATATQTGGGGGQGGGGGPIVRETRAIEAAAAGPVFRTPTMARVEQQSQKVADRWAPDGAQAEKQQPSLRALGFADRMIVGYLGGGTRESAAERSAAARETQPQQPQQPQQQTTGAPARTDEGRVRAEQPASAASVPQASATPAVRNEMRPRESIARTRSAGAIDRAVPTVSWLFPTPWFEDELKWAAAAKAATRETERAAVRAGEAERTARTARATGVGVPLELVAPSMAAQRPGERVMQQPAAETRPAQADKPSAALRAYSPLIDPAAARAAELLAGMARREAAQARKQAQGEDVAPRPSPILEYVAPADLAAQRAPNAQTQAAAQRTLDAPAQRVDTAAKAAEKATAEKAAAERAAAEKATAEKAAAERAAAEKTTGDRAAARSAADKAAAEKAAADKVAAEKATAEKVAADKAAAEKAAAGKRSATASELLAKSALSPDKDRVAPAAGPRVMLPAGLGGLSAATQAARTVEQPVAKTEARAAAPTPAAPMVGRERPAALDHLVWSDRWLARFAGASAPALKTFDLARTPVTATTEKSAMSGWDPAWVKPPPVAKAQRSEPAETRPRPAPEMVVPLRAGATVVDETEPVSDADFGAIAAAASADRARQQSRARTQEKSDRKPAPAQAGRQGQAAAPAAKVEPPAPLRAPAADRALDQVKPSRTAGLGASLGASPVAPLLSNLVEVPKQPAFDARQMSAASLASLPPVTVGRGAGGLRELAGRAPGEVFVQGEADRKADAEKQAAAAKIAAAKAREAKPTPVVAPKPVVVEAPKAKAPEPAPVRAPVPVVAEAPRAKAKAPETPRPVPDAARPGNIGAGAESFAQKRVMAASDLSLDFLSPEVLLAARAYGFGPIDAARAQRLAASGRPRITDLASQVDRVFVEALSAPQERPAAKPEAAAAAESRAKAQADARSQAEAKAVADSKLHADARAQAEARAQSAARTQAEAKTQVERARSEAAPQVERAQADAQAKAKAEAQAQAKAKTKVDAKDEAAAQRALPPQPLHEAAPPRTPRGAFLLPEASARAMGVKAKNAEESRPDIRFALDLVAAGHVADAAAARGPFSERKPGDSKDRPGGAAAERPPAAEDRRDPNDARALLPRELWAVFDIVYVSLGESSSAGADGRPLAPAARAAKALALTSKSRDSAEGLPLSARARAAAAWAVLPTVMNGGQPRDKADAAAGEGTAGKAPASRPVVAGAEPTRFEAPRAELLSGFASTRAGESLGSLVAPSFVAADHSGDREGDEQRARAQQARAQQQQTLLSRQESMPVSTPVVQTGVPPQPRQAEPPPQPRPEPAQTSRSSQPRQYSSQPAPPGSGDVPAWFQDAAKKYFGESGGSSGGMSMAELTLVTAAPQAQVAASATSAARPVVQAESTSAVGAAGGVGPAAQQAETKADIDKIAQEVFEQICRMLEVARERSGDPWQR